MTKKPIAYLISQYPSTSHTFILREIRELRRRGFQLITASVNQPDRAQEKLSKREQEAQVSCFYIKQEIKRRPWKLLYGLKKPLSLFCCLLDCIIKIRHGISSCYKHFGYLAEAITLAHYLHQKECRHVHVHFANPAASIACYIKKLFDIDYSMTVDGPDVFYDITKLELEEKFHYSKKIAAISNYCRSQILRLLPPSEWHKVEVSRLGVHINDYMIENQEQLPTTKQIICVGRIVPAKGQMVLLEAFAKTYEEHTDSHLHFIGDGSDRQRLQERTKDLKIDQAVTFHGALQEEVVTALLKKSHLFVLASFAEGLPVSLMEAMASQLPCISTWVNGIPELIQDGKNGLLVPPGDAESLSQALSDLLNHPKRAKAIGEEGRKTATEHYSLKININSLENILHDCVVRDHSCQ